MDAAHVATCAEIVDHGFTLMDPSLARMKPADATKLRESMIDACQHANLSPAAIDCYMRSTTLDTYSHCDAKKIN
jgi:hypothetical protein